MSTPTIRATVLSILGKSFRSYLATDSRLVAYRRAISPPRGVIPFLSPMPNTEVSTWVAPASRASKALAMAQPASLCPWNSISALTRLRSSLTSSYTCRGVATPTVSAIPTRFTPMASTASYTRKMSLLWLRNESSVLNRTSTPWLCTNSITSWAISTIWSMSLPWLNSRSIEDVPITTSMPSTPVSIATVASSTRQRTCVSSLALRPSFLIVLMSS